MFWKLPGGSGLCSAGVRVAAGTFWAERTWRAGVRPLGLRGGQKGPARVVKGTSPVCPCPCSLEPHPPQLPRYPDSSRGVNPQECEPPGGAAAWGWWEALGCPSSSRLAGAFLSSSLGQKYTSDTGMGPFPLLFGVSQHENMRSPPHPIPRCLWHPHYWYTSP